MRLLRIFAILICFIASASPQERAKRAFLPYRTGKKVASQVSNALDHLLFFSGYDKQIRPGVSYIPRFIVNPNYIWIILGPFIKKDFI